MDEIIRTIFSGAMKALPNHHGMRPEKLPDGSSYHACGGGQHPGAWGWGASIEKGLISLKWEKGPNKDRVFCLVAGKPVVSNDGFAIIACFPELYLLGKAN